MLYNLALVIWVACWFIWKERNTLFFEQKELLIGVLLDKVKTLVWWWLKTKKKKINYNLNMWCGHIFSLLILTLVSS
jgi:hypothetical protein